MNVIFLPMWANAALFAAIIVLFALALSKRTQIIQSQTAYYIGATAMVMALAATFLVLAPMKELYVSYLVLVVIVLFIAFLVSILGGMDEPIEGKKKIIKLAATVAAIVVIFLTLIYGSTSFAAIWGGVLIALVLIGKFLFPAPKSK